MPSLRSHMIRLASTLPKGDTGRTELLRILAGTQRMASDTPAGRAIRDFLRKDATSRKAVETRIQGGLEAVAEGTPRMRTPRFPKMSTLR